MSDIWTVDEEARRLDDRFKAIKASNGVGQAEFARTHKVPGGASMVSQHIKGRRPMNLEAATAYAKGFECRLDEISPRLAKIAAGAAAVAGREVETKAPYQSNVEDAPEIVGALKRIPVVGRVQAGEDGLIHIDEYPPGHGDGYMMWWSSCENAYALRIRGESMSPRYLPGEFVGVDPCADVAPSDEVIVLLRNGKRMIKRLLWRRDDQACFESVNKNFQNIVLDVEEIEKLHLVLGNIPKAAFRSE